MVVSRRELVIVGVLERWDELVEPGAKLGVAGDGDSVPRMPRTYTPTVREIERLIHSLRDDPRRPIFRWTDDQGVKHAASTRKLWWHLNEWFLKAERRMVEPPSKVHRNRRKGQLQRPQVDQYGRVLPQVRVFRHAEARYLIALGAVEWLAAEWSLPVEPMLPQEVLVAA